MGYSSSAGIGFRCALSAADLEKWKSQKSEVRDQKSEAEEASRKGAKDAEDHDGVYVATAATGEKIPHPLSRKTYPVEHEGKTVQVPEGMVYVPAGTFLMGVGDKPSEGPHHEVYLDAYLIGKYEVTNAEYAEFVKATNHPAPEHWAGGKIPEGGENHPVVYVNWDDATAYAAWCGKRLPTEAEWEKAAGWDPDKRKHREYPWGDEYDPARANHCYQLGCRCKGDGKIHWPWWEKWSKSEEGKKIIAEGGHTAAAGQFKGDESFFKCFDMGGNVREWVNDWYREDYYKVGPKKNPAGPTEAEATLVDGQPCRVLRGGYWPYYRTFLRTSIRPRYVPTSRTYDLGFRCAADYPWKPGTAGTGQEAPTAPAGDEAAWQNAINLLPLIDPKKDAVAGVWQKTEDGLMSDIGFVSRVQIPYQPPDEYDFRIEFTRLKAKGKKGTVGWGDVFQVLQKDGRPFHWYMGAHGNTWFGFELVGGKRFDKNATGVKTEECLQLQHRYSVTVVVRKDSVNAVLHGKPISEWRPEFGALSEGPYAGLIDKTFIGLGACNVQTVFHRIEVREVTGKGTFTRGKPPATTGAIPVDDAFCKEVAALPPEEQVKRVVAKLQELNPGFDGKVFHAIGNNEVIKLHFTATEVTDISPLRALPKLRKLYCGVLDKDRSKRSKLADLTPLKGMQLVEFRCPGTDVGDLSPVQGMPVTFLGFNYTRVTDLSALRHMPLDNLHFRGAEVGDLSPLEGMSLRILECPETKVRDFSPLRNAPLQDLKCDPAVAAGKDNQAILRSMKTLEKINDLPAAEFWGQVEAGKLPPPPPPRPE